MRTKELKSKLFDIYDEMLESYNVAADIAFNRRMSELKPGEKVPEKGSLFYDDNRMKLDEKLMKLKVEAREVIDEAMNQIKAYKTDPPSDEVVNYLTLMKMQKNISSEDINNAIDRYGDNYIAYKTITDIAVDHKIFTFDDSNLDRIEKSIDDVMININKWSSNEVERNNPTPGKVEMYKIILDSSIPDVEIGG